MSKILTLLIIMVSLCRPLLAQNDTLVTEGGTEIIQETEIAPVVSEPTPALKWNGTFLTDNRLNLYNGNNHFSWEEYRLTLAPEIRIGNRTSFKSELWVRTLNFSGITSFSQLSAKDYIQNIDVDLREAYFDVYGFLSHSLDIRIGRQRIAWGTADKLNPTDNINPYDMEDLWDFGRHLASNSIKAMYYLKDFTFTGVFVPVYTPTLAPDSSLVQALMPDFNFPASVNNNNSLLFLKYNSIIDSLILPERNIENSIFAFKIEKPFGNFNTSLSYTQGRDILPSPFQTDIKPLSLIGDTITIDVKSQIKYPRMRIVGGDFAGSVFNIGIWGEAAVFLPEKISNHTTMKLLGITLMEQDSVTVEDKPYVKISAGFDYTFKNGWYFNMQYLHGFVHEKGNDLNDYYVTSLSCPLFNDKVKLSPANACLVIDDYKDILNRYAFIYMPEITYAGIDNAQFSMGARIIEGSSKTSFGKLSNHDEVFLKMKYSF